MNDTIKHQLEHRTYREFTGEKIPEDTMNTLFEVANRTATSVGVQSFSIIRVTDPEIRKEIAEVCNQEYVARAPELLIFISDCYRNREIAKEQGIDTPVAKGIDRFFQGVSDAVLAAQNMTNAIESLGMGAVYLGSILNDPERIIELLHLPELTFPVLGLGFGYPNQKPLLKPRMPFELKVFENEYQVLPSYMEALKEYDEEMMEYYDLRDSNRRRDTFTHQVLVRFEQVIEKRTEMLRVVKKQGFDLNVGE